jgi:hypothetical protein
MKKAVFFLMVAVMSTSLFFQACNDEEETPGVITVKIGAQTNTTIGGFYSVSENKVYTMDVASNNPGVIDILCFYEASTGNNIALASPGSGITGIFTGSTAPENWSVKDTTFFCATTLTTAQFDAVTESDELIVTSFVEDDARKKAKDMKVDDVYSFRVQAGTYGLLKVTAVTQGIDGDVTFEVKMKK